MSKLVWKTSTIIVTCNGNISKVSASTLVNFGAFSFVSGHGSGHGGAAVLLPGFCYQSIAKLGNKTAIPPWPGPYIAGSFSISRSVHTVALSTRKCWFVRRTHAELLVDQPELSWSTSVSDDITQEIDQCQIYLIKYPENARPLTHKHRCNHPWWRHQMETFSALLAICQGIHRWIPRTKASDAGFGVFFDLRLNKRLSKQSWAGDLRRHRAHYDVIVMTTMYAHTSYTPPSPPRAHTHTHRHTDTNAPAYYRTRLTSSSPRLSLKACDKLIWFSYNIHQTMHTSPPLSWAYFNNCTRPGACPPCVWYGNQIRITVTSWWARWRLKWSASRVFAQPIVLAQIEENIKVPHHWAFVRGIHRWPVDSPHKGPVTQKMFPFDDVIMPTSVCYGD